MTTRSRRLAIGFLTVAAGVVLTACGGPSTASSPASSPPSNIPTVGPSSAPSTTPSSPAASAPASAAVGQTDTEWGRIWDGVPEGFPRYTGARDGDDATADPVSDAYVVEGGDAAEIAAWLQAAMEVATYSTEGLSGPLEGGDFVLDSVGDEGCRIQTSIVPQGGLVLVTVRYGADCPAS